MFKDRKEAGHRLSRKLTEYKSRQDSLIIALPRGGVVVGTTVADNLLIPLMLLPVKKLSAPGNPELAIGAVTMGEVKYLDWDFIDKLNVESDFLSGEIRKKYSIVMEQAELYKTKLERLSEYKNYIVVDDGIATGWTARAVINLLKKQAGKKSIIIAAPVISKDVDSEFKKEVDSVITLLASDEFRAVGQFYRSFDQVSDEEVIRLISGKLPS